MKITAKAIELAESMRVNMGSPWDRLTAQEFYAQAAMQSAIEHGASLGALLTDEKPAAVRSYMAGDE